MLSSSLPFRLLLEYVWARERVGLGYSGSILFAWDNFSPSLGVSDKESQLSDSQCHPNLPKDDRYFQPQSSALKSPRADSHQNHPPNHLASTSSILVFSNTLPYLIRSRAQNHSRIDFLLNASIRPASEDLRRVLLAGFIEGFRVQVMSWSRPAPCYLHEMTFTGTPRSVRAGASCAGVIRILPWQLLQDGHRKRFTPLFRRVGWQLYSTTKSKPK